MKIHLRIFWLVSLTIFTSGCSGFQSACYTRTDNPSDGNISPLEVCDLRGGEKVRITTVEGNRVVGKIDRITPEWVVLQPDGPGTRPLLYSPSQIVSIERSSSRPSESPEMDRPEIGDDVSLYLVDGKHVEGKVLVFNDKEIVLENNGRSSQPNGYPMEQVEWLVVKKGGGSSWVVPVVGIVVVGLLVGGAMLAKSMEDSFSFGQN